MTMPFMQRHMTGNIHGPPHQDEQPWQPEPGVRGRDMYGQTLPSEMRPQQGEFGGPNGGFEPQGPPHRGRGAPLKRRRGQPVGFDNPNDNFDTSFNSGGPEPPFPHGEQEFGQEPMMQPRRRRMRHGGDNMMGPGADMPPPGIDMDMQMQMDGNMNDMDDNAFGPGPQGPHMQGAGFDGPPGAFGGQPPALGPRHGRRGGMHGMHPDNLGMPPLLDEFDAPGQGGPQNFMDAPDDSMPPGIMQDEDMGFQLGGPPFGPGPDQGPGFPPSHRPQRRRRFSDSNLPSFRPPAFQDDTGDFGVPLGRRGGLRRPTFDQFEDNDSTRMFGSDPTGDRRHHRVSYDDESLPSMDTRDSRSTRSKRRQILFYDEKKPYFGFSNKSPYSVVYRGRKYPTAEHLYHAMKFERRRPDIAERIRTCSSKPNVAISEARRYQRETRSDWRDVKKRKMAEILELKFDQHRDLRDQLVATGSAELVEASYKDPFWGVGPDGVGNNEFGRTLERLRDDLRYSRRTRRGRSPPRTDDRGFGRYTRSRSRRSRGTVYFFDHRQDHYGFSNYSSYPVVYRGKRYPTSQHLFQSMKFIDVAPQVAEHIRLFSPYPDVATAEAHRHSGEVRRDWKTVSYAKMEETLWHKFTQHPDLQRELLETGSADLVFDAREDSRWGAGADGRGHNELGKALERVRSKLRSYDVNRHASTSNPSFDSDFGRASYRSVRPPSSKLTRRASRGSSLPRFMTGIFGGRRSRDQITFDYRTQPYHGFSNFAPYSVTYEGRRYPTAEHLFQSLKFEKDRPDLAEHIRTCSSSPQTAISEARRFPNQVRSDWRSVNGRKMEEVLWLKFAQHRRLADALVATEDAELIEDNDRDAYWGTGSDGQGRNEFGKTLEKIRSRLRH